MKYNGQTYELIHKLEIKGAFYGLFFHEKSHRHSLWILTDDKGWERIGDIYNVPALLKFYHMTRADRSWGYYAVLFAFVLAALAQFVFNSLS